MTTSPAFPGMVVVAVTGEGFSYGIVVGATFPVGAYVANLGDPIVLITCPK